ncbi:MAG: ferritin-like domain-containing protein [Chitinophagales bacterium]|nr:ferritin-like domain-containing protein [Chitinophagales bacterium]
MKINDIIKYFEQAEEGSTATTRRSALKDFGVKVAMASLPFAAGSLYTKKANAQSKETLINILNYLLKLELIVAEFYTQAYGTANLIPAAFSTQFQSVVDQNKSHVATLQRLVTELGGTPYTIIDTDIDITGGRGSGNGEFVNSLSNFTTFIVQAQYFTDGAVRLYKGQIFEVLTDNITVRALMNIHSTKARQATFIRFTRKYMDGTKINPWITGTNTDTTNTAVQRMYAGESITEQLGIYLPGLNGFDNITIDVSTEAFDEPINKVDGENIINRFIKG